MRRGRILTGAATLLVMVAAPVLVSAHTAEAVQTDTFGLAASDGAAAIIVRPGGTTTSAVTVSNRTSHPITVDVQAVAASRDSAGTYAYGAPGQGLAKDIRLAATEVPLKGGTQAVVHLSIDAPSSTSLQFGAITATLRGGGAAGVQQRLAVIVAVSAKAPPSSTFQRSHPSSTSSSLPLAVVLAAIALILLAVIGVVLAGRRRLEEM